jgi:hypothetical protein
VARDLHQVEGVYTVHGAGRRGWAQAISHGQRPAETRKAHAGRAAPRGGTSLAAKARVNGPTEQARAIVPVDPRRSALELRIHIARERLVQDLNRASSMIRASTHRIGRAFEIAAIGGLLLLGAGVALFMRRRRARFTWR